jgi:hypothetical protein
MNFSKISFRSMAPETLPDDALTATEMLRITRIVADAGHADKALADNDAWMAARRLYQRQA